MDFFSQSSFDSKKELFLINTDEKSLSKTFLLAMDALSGAFLSLLFFHTTMDDG